MTYASPERLEFEGEPSPLSDPSAWTRLIEELRPDALLVVIASAMSNSLQRRCPPEDILQETLAQAWSSRDQHRWQGRAAFQAWLLEIARNRIRDAARRANSDKRGGGRKDARLSEAESGLSASTAGHLPPDSNTPSRILMQAEQASAWQRALAALPPELEPVVRLHLVEGLPMDEIARRLGVGTSTAWRRYHKGAEICSKVLADFESGAPDRKATPPGPAEERAVEGLE